MESSFLILLLLGLTFSSARQVLRIQPHATDSQSYYGDSNSQISEIHEEEDRNLKEISEYSLANRPSVHQLRAVSRTSNSKNVLSHLSKIQPVQTIRNYNKVNDDGSFTFGYEAADGSFKEETRGADCVVRGKYGYIDPDGNKREFTYVSGNPCDPNSDIDDEEELLSKKQKNDNEEFEDSANYPSVRPLLSVKPNYPKKQTATTPSTILHREVSELLNRNINNQEYKINDEPASAVLIKPNYRTQSRQNYYSVAPVQADSSYSTTPHPKVASSTQITVPTTLHRSTTSSSKYNTHGSPSSIQYLQQYTTPSYAKLESASSRSPQLESTAATIAITPRPHSIQVATEYLSPASNNGNYRNPSSNNNERPKVMYSKPHALASSVLSSTLNENVKFNFAPELEDYVNTDSVIKNVLSSTSPKSLNVKSSKPVYQSQLVYNPSSGHYKTQLYQTLPQHQLQPLVAQQILNQPSSQIELHQVQASLTGRTSAASRQSQPQEKIYQQQQTEQLLQSQQLFAQQQRHQQHKLQSAAIPKYQYLAAQKDPQTYYYAVTPTSVPSPTSSISLEQIDQFLRGRTSTF
ncbi:uncharacterized protein [Chelonus insularis]|uniref:uncharacterized protein n=1 Tax=Chelonus insularis TaxID=460826 RepID=UPI001588BF55|nr:uncharacterized protein LOC118070466 [Chelonus insularis]